MAYPKNAASPPALFAGVVNATDGAPITVGVAAKYSTGAGAQAAGLGTCQHEGNGQWSYTPTQAETNVIAFGIQFYHADAVGDGPTISVVTTADVAQTGDVYAQVGVAGAGLTALGDTRLANLDAAVSTRSTYAGGAVASVTGAVGSVTGAVGSVTGNVGGNVVGSVGSVAGNVVGSVGSVTGLTASNLDATVSSRAVAGNAMTLTAAYDAAKTAAQAGEAAAAVAGLSTFAPATDEVETGITWAEWAKVLGSVLAGVASGGGTTTVVFKALDNSGTTRVTATVDANGNRSAVTLSL